ncbi:MAG TPA: UDP-N-acetylmuramoyl-tripeptide--D-alanyl-D-alanine ligase [Candidatus Desulfofervidus auxilii]|uniref:UDP-N-acetylmuramoyl-tripeptide--D-alanyl-D-alanine ligase n=1 Tax=Desulfofervidus auxilii TaxID=1621989 RepID=A0A7C0Y3V0_DESA2|nr:UDP-N-acetylmuramoyl-tripeptide--D-alanyl-D-alanine ligase [Candidatus Desulfofervidus auxilii]
MRQVGNWPVKEILDATKGTLLSGQPEMIFTGITDDTRMLKPNDLFIALKGKRYDGHIFIPEAIKKGALGIILKNNYDFNLPQNIAVIAVEDTLKALGDLAHYQRKKFNFPFITITGSSGKTTTKEAIAHVLAQQFRVLKTKENYNNQIGVPFTLLGLTSFYNAACIELGTNSLGEIDYLSRITQPDIGVITSIQPAHLEGLKSLKEIQKEKGSMLKYVNECFVYNCDDKRVAELANDFTKKKIAFGFRAGEIRAKDIKISKNTLHFTLILPENSLYIKSQLIGQHQIYALLAAAAIGWYFKLSPFIIQQALESFLPLSNRLSLYMTLHGFYLLDDTYNANPGSMKAALETLKQFNGRIAVLGDMLELGEETSFWHKELGKWAANTGLKALILFGEYAPLIKEGAIEAGMNEKKIYLTTKKEDIIEIIHNIAAKYDVVLFKASRKIQFEKLIETLKRKK